MRILFICTAHNSLSQRLYLALSRTHDVSIEYALSDELMITAVSLAAPDLVICPFLTTMVPKAIYEKVLTLIIHPGPPGDVGPSALDWVLLGDDGSVDNDNELLKKLDVDGCQPGRTHWGITVLQAIEQFDAGPVWAFEDFAIEIDQPGLTKSELYRGPVANAAIVATLAAINRIQSAPLSKDVPRAHPKQAYSQSLQVDSNYGRLAVSSNQPFQGGRLHHRPLLKANQREFDVKRHTAQHISRRIRCGDSQPGVLSKVFGTSLYVYGGIVDDNDDGRLPTWVGRLPTTILGVRNEAICIATCDGKGVWITHIRRPKTKNDNALWPKVPAVSGLIEMNLITALEIQPLTWPIAIDWRRSSAQTLQEVWVDMQFDNRNNKTAYLYFDFYNGAMSTDQCFHLVKAMDFILSEHTPDHPVQAVVLMGGSYFSNGINLNVIESAANPAMESWRNINLIDDIVHYLLDKFPARDIVTVAAIRGNAAAGGVALAAACDIVVAGSSVVLNPAYRAVGLYGSEYHTLSYYGRCGETTAKQILRAMVPMSPLQAQSIGLVDYVFPGTGAVLEDYVRTHIAYLLKPGILRRGVWKRNIDLSPICLARARANELGEMSLDFWSARSTRYHSRRYDFVRKVKPTSTPLRFATHRMSSEADSHDEEELDSFDSVQHFEELNKERLLADLRQNLAAEISQAVNLKDGSAARRASIATLVDPNRLEQALDKTREKKAETLFSCYYKPLVEELPTPPLSPGEMDRMPILS